MYSSVPGLKIKMFYVTKTKECRGKKKKVCSFLLLETEKAMATHSSPLAWKIPWIGEPGRLQSMESHRVGHN